MQSLRKNTLLDISRLTNPILKLASYLKESDMPFYINKLNDTLPTTTPNDYLKAFDSDINKTVDLTFDLLTAWRNSPTNFISELKTDNKNISELFDVEGSKINLFNETFFKNADYDKKEIKNTLISGILGISLEEYNIEYKKAKDDYNENNILADDATDDEKFLHLVRLADKDVVMQLVNKISSIAEQQRDFRNDLSLEEKRLIDNQITFSRTMIDGVLDTSTFITQEEGVVNISPKHSKDISSESKAKKIHKLLKENKYFDQAEIDQDADLDKVVSLLEETNKLKVNISQKQIFKVRKLGNYGNGNVRGLYFPGYKIVSFDVNHPSAFIHELTHAVDFNNDFVQEDLRFKFVSHFYNILKEQYFTGEYTEGRFPVKKYQFPPDWHYLSRDVEIIARLGEIGYLLNKYDYQGHKNEEELNDFLSKIREKQKDTINNSEKDILISNSIDFYSNNLAYFGLTHLKEDDIKLIKDFYSAFYYSNRQSYDNINYSLNEKRAQIKQNIREKNKVKSNKFIKEEHPLCFLRNDNFVNLCNINEEKRIFERKKLFEYIIKNSHDLCKRGLKDSQEVLQKRLDTFFNFALNYKELNDQYKKELKEIFFLGKEENLAPLFISYNKFFENNENTQIGYNSRRLLGVIREVSIVLSDKALQYINGEIAEEYFSNYIDNREYLKKIDHNSEYKHQKIFIDNNIRDTKLNLRNHILDGEELNNKTKEYLLNTQNNIEEYNSQIGMSIYLNLLTNHLVGFDKYGQTFYSELSNIKKELISKNNKNDLSKYAELLNSSFEEFLKEFKEREHYNFLTDYFRGQTDRLNYAKDKHLLISFSDFNTESKLKFFKNYFIKNIESDKFKIPKTLINKKVIKKYPDIKDEDIIDFLDNDLKIKHISPSNRKNIILENFDVTNIKSKTIRKILTEPEYNEYSTFSGLNYRDSSIGFINADNHKIIQKLAEDRYSKEDILQSVRQIYLDVNSEEEKKKHKEIRDYLKEKSKSSEFLILHNMMQEYLKNDNNFSDNEKNIEVINKFNSDTVESTFKDMLLQANKKGIINSDKELTKEQQKRLLNIMKPINQVMSKRKIMNTFFEKGTQLINNISENEKDAINNNCQIKPITIFSLQNIEKFKPQNIAIIGKECENKKSNKLKV